MTGNKITTLAASGYKTSRRPLTLMIKDSGLGLSHYYFMSSRFNSIHMISSGRILSADCQEGVNRQKLFLERGFRGLAIGLRCNERKWNHGQTCQTGWPSTADYF